MLKKQNNIWLNFGKHEWSSGRPSFLWYDVLAVCIPNRDFHIAGMDLFF